MKTAFLTLCGFFFSMTVHAHPDHADHAHGHLSFQNGALHAHLAWEAGPNGDGSESKMRLEWHDGATHALVDPNGNFGVSLWMPSMGHGSAPTKIQRVDVGVYQVSNMYFVMSGDWDIRVTLTPADGSAETQAWSIVVDGDHDHGHGH